MGFAELPYQNYEPSFGRNICLGKTLRQYQVGGFDRHTQDTILPQIVVGFAFGDLETASGGNNRSPEFSQKPMSQDGS